MKLSNTIEFEIYRPRQFDAEPELVLLGNTFWQNSEHEPIIDDFVRLQLNNDTGREPLICRVTSRHLTPTSLTCHCIVVPWADCVYLFTTQRPWNG